MAIKKKGNTGFLLQKSLKRLKNRRKMLLWKLSLALKQLQKLVNRLLWKM